MEKRIVLVTPASSRQATDHTRGTGGVLRDRYGVVPGRAFAADSSIETAVEIAEGSGFPLAVGGLQVAEKELAFLNELANDDVHIRDTLVVPKDAGWVVRAIGALERERGIVLRPPFRPDDGLEVILLTYKRSMKSGQMECVNGQNFGQVIYPSVRQRA